MTRYCTVVVVAVLWSLALAGPAWGQAAQLTTDVGPHYVGDAVSIRVTAVGFEEDPPPVAEVAQPVGGRLELVGVSPSVSQSITITNGQMSRTREVTHVFQFRFAAERSGNVRVGPFRIVQGSRETTVPMARLKIQAAPSNDDVRVRLELPEGEVYVGERVPVTVSFTLEQSLQKNALGYVLRVPLFDSQSTFRFLDEEEAAGDTNVVVDTGSRQLELRGQSREHKEKRKSFVTVSVKRTLVPLAPGTHRIPGVSFSVEEGVRFRRDFFGGRRATQVRRWQAQDAGRSLVVAGIPGGEQPASFGGAIGRGFSLEVAADRTVVQVGDPITLRFTVRGEGLETASLPPLDAKGLLPADLFRVPTDVPTGALDGEGKRFTAVVRVLDDRVTEIPALEYSWFDPSAKRYETTHSLPIALAVRAAEVIGAGDVQVTAEAEAAQRAARRDADTEGRASRSGSFALTGADLAIETDAAVVLGQRVGWAGRWLAPSLYAGSLALVAAALLDRRRRRIDPEWVRRARVMDEELARVRAASSLSPSDGARQVAEAVRRMLREAPEAASAAADELLGECDARSYAPAGQEAPLGEAFLSRAESVAEAIVRSAREAGR